MRSSSSVGLGLSLVFGCLLLALIAELYYLLCWKKRATNNNTREIQESYHSPTREFLYLFCWKKPSSLTSTGITADTQVHEPQASSSSSSSWFRPLAGESYEVDMTVETELLRLQNLSGPPRFLFTIKEETKEDLESEDRSKKGSRGRSLSDVVFTVETPYFTPLASPPNFTPPITPRDSIYRPFSPLRHSSSDAEFNRIWASPPPKFKFLRDAEDKLQKRRLIEKLGVDGCVQKSDGVKDDENGSFITLIVSKENENGHHNNISSLYPSSSSQVLPLAASPPVFRPRFHKNPSSH